jgi:hypothetical protein
MTDREKVVKGLECCLGDTRTDLPNLCTICPYAHGSYATQTCGKKLREDALALLKAQEQKCRECGEATSKAIQELQAKLKAQEPRVMTAEQIADLKYHDMVYVEFKHPRKEEYRVLNGFVDQMYKDTDTCEIKAIDITLGVNEIAHCSMKLYLNDFRLWTSRPPEEQMKAVKWEE